MRTHKLTVFALRAVTLAVATLSPWARCDASANAGDKEPARTDRYGDPLPKGAVTRLGTVRFSQPFPGSIAFAPDGKILASGGYDNRIRLWDPDTGKEVRALEGHTSYVNCIAMSADGKWLASGSQDKDLRLWEVNTGKERRRFQGHRAPIERLALSPDGKVLASSCQEATLRLWDTDSGKEIRSVPIDPPHGVLAMAFTPDGKHLAFNNRTDQGIQLLDVAEGKRVRAFMGHKDNVEQLTFSADGTTLISGGSDRTIRVWDVVSGKELRRCGNEKMHVRCLAVAPDEKTLTYGTTDGLVHIWDIAGNKDLVPPWKAHQYCVVSIAYSPDSKRVAVARDTIAIHETATGKRLNPPPENDSRVQQIEYSADGKLLAVWRQDNTIEVWDVAKWRTMATLDAKMGRFRSMAFARGGKFLTTAEGDYIQGAHQAVLCHWDPYTGKRRREYQFLGSLESLSYAADGETAAWNQLGQQNVFILWDLTTGTERGRIMNLDGTARNPRLAPDGRLLACRTAKNAVALWDAKSGKLAHGFGKTFPGAGQLVTFSPDGKTVATPGGNVDPRKAFEPDVVLWETATGQERLRILINEGNVRPIVFSPDGRMLASVSESETIRLWDAWTGKAVSHFKGHRGWIGSLSFAPDGKTLASAGADSTVLIWDVAGLAPPAKKQAEKLDRDQLAKCLEDLGGTDAVRAYQTMAELAWRPGQAEELLRDIVVAALGKNSKQLARLIADLDSDDFSVRDKAYKELADLGTLAEAALTRGLQKAPSLEASRRVQELLRKLEGKPENPERRRVLRTIEVLERLGTPQARAFLASLENEATEAETAREAKSSLERLNRAGKHAP